VPNEDAIAAGHHRFRLGDDSGRVGVGFNPLLGLHHGLDRRCGLRGSRLPLLFLLQSPRHIRWR
jgi:hypothetical protein